MLWTSNNLMRLTHIDLFAEILLVVILIENIIKCIDLIFFTLLKHMMLNCVWNCENQTIMNDYF